LRRPRRERSSPTKSREARFYWAFFFTGREVRLEARFPKTPAEALRDSVTEAILDYLRLPGRFDPAKGIETLEGYLVQAAWRKVSNLLRNERRRQEREQAAGQKIFEDFCQISPSSGEVLYEDPMQDSTQLLAEFWNWVESLNHADGRVVELWVSGERDLSTFVRLLGLTDRTPAEQRKAVNRAKNRLHKALRRWMKQWKNRE
jgi:DNA-directed RNA polymerase specialized sigma24 family protein